MRLPSTFSFSQRMTISNVVSSIVSDLTSQIANPFAKPQHSPPVGPVFYFFQLLEFCALHREYCAPLALGQDVYYNAVYTAIAVCIGAFDCTLVGKHVCSSEGVPGSNTTTPKILPKVDPARWRLLRNVPSKGHHSQLITLFFKGTYSVIGFYELMGLSLAG